MKMFGLILIYLTIVGSIVTCSSIVSIDRDRAEKAETAKRIEKYQAELADTTGDAQQAKDNAELDASLKKQKENTLLNTKWIESQKYRPKPVYRITQEDADRTNRNIQRQELEHKLNNQTEELREQTRELHQIKRELEYARRDREDREQDLTRF